MDISKKIRISTFISLCFLSLSIFLCSAKACAQADDVVPVEEMSESTALSGPDELPDPADLADIDEQIDADALPTADPYQRFNRQMYCFNDIFDTYFLKPVAKIYNLIIPRPLNLGIHNFFSNINNIPTIFNDVLQAHFYQAANDFWRLTINTTLGLGGLFDIAARLGLDPYTNDFGLTLATWGYKNSNYLVLPFFGPNTIRDGIEIPVDYYLFSIYPGLHPLYVRYTLLGFNMVDRRAQLLKYQSLLDEVSIDPYAFQRNAYMQRRACQIAENARLGVGVRERLPVTPKQNRPMNTNIGT